MATHHGGARERSSRRRLALGLTLAAVFLVACGGQDGDSDSPSTQDPTTSPTEDYAARVNGASTAHAPSTVLLTLSNVGAEDDTYGVTVSPKKAGEVDTPHLSIESGRSGKFRVDVRSTPLTLEIESVGAGGTVDEFTIR